MAFSNIRSVIALSVATANFYTKIKDAELAVMFSGQSAYFSTVNRMKKGQALAPAPIRLSSQDWLESQIYPLIASANPVADFKASKINRSKPLAAQIQQILPGYGASILPFVRLHLRRKRDFDL